MSDMSSKFPVLPSGLPSTAARELNERPDYHIKKEQTRSLKYLFYAVGVEKGGKPLYRCHIAGANGSGTSGSILAEFHCHEKEFLKLKPSGKQEIGTWRPSRHKTFRIHF
jgi:hypothetical protein